MCDDSNNNNFSRRNFLGSAFTLGAGTFLLDPVRALTEGIADALILKAHAEATGINVSRNYINIQMPGGPLRYQFDQWLKIKTDEQLKPVTINGLLNPMICNSLEVSSTGVVSVKYKNFSYRNVLTPFMFSHSVYNSKGDKRPLTELLDNMLVIRGYGTGLDGHQFNMLAQQLPIGGVNTITGVVAENTKSTFDSIQWPDRGGNSVFVSNQGKSQNKVAGATPLVSLMEGFKSSATNPVRSLKTKYQESMDLAQSRLKQYIRSENSGSRIVASNLTNASEMMKKGITGIETYWAAAVLRYKAAIEKSMREINLPGISDKEIISNESGQFAIGVGGETIIPSSSVDLRKALAKVSLQNLAEGLALCEYMIKQGLAYSIDIKADSLLNMEILTKGATETKMKNLNNDMHSTGSVSSILFITSYYRGLAAGILELKDQLGSEIWNNTVIQLQGDFGRSARSDGTGSDHGFRQMVTSVFSGAFTNGPVIVGNILKNGTNANYDGTQGLAASIDNYNQKGPPTPAMAAATVTALLGVDKNPYQNTAGPLVSLENGVLKPLYAPKIVG